MAGNVESIRSFLVDLGFKLDEPALKKFTKAIDTATSVVFKLGAAIEATALVVAAGIAKWSGSLEQLYFASQRTGSSVQALRAMDRAAQDFGTTSGEMLSSIEGLAHALRMNPFGTQGLLEGLGVHLKYTKSGAVDSANAVLQLSTAFQKLVAQNNGQLYVAEQYAQILGLNEHTLLALLNPNFQQQFERTLRLSRGVNWEKAASDAHKFQNQLRDLGTELEALGYRIVDALQKKLGVSLDDILKWVDKNGPRIADDIIHIGKWIIDSAITIVRWVKEVVAQFNAWGVSTSTLLKVIAGLAVLKATGAGSIVGGLLSFAGGLLRVGAAAPGLVAVAAAIASIVTAAKSLRNFADGKDASNPISRFVDSLLPGKGTTVGNMIYDWWHLPKGIRYHNPGNLKFAGQPGAYDLGGFADFMTSGQGLNALARQLARYAAGGNDTIAGIIDRYAPAGDGNNVPAYIRDVLTRTGIRDPGQHLDLLHNPQLLANVMNAIVSHEQGMNPYSAGDVNAAAQTATARPIVVRQDIRYNITGSNAKEIADRVEDKQKRVNSELTRNFAPQVQ
jgi:hypothetical protein